MYRYVSYSNVEFKFGLLKNLTRPCLYKTEKPLSALAVRLSGVSATLVPTDSHKQPIPLFPPQIWRGQGKWWMASPLGCQGLLILRWIIPQKPPSSSITPTPHRECDMDFSQRVVDCFRKRSRTSGVQMLQPQIKGLWADDWCIRGAGSVVDRHHSCLLKVTG